MKTLYEQELSEFTHEMGKITNSKDEGNNGMSKLRKELLTIMNQDSGKLEYEGDYWYYIYEGLLDSKVNKGLKNLVFVIGDTSGQYEFEIAINVVSAQAESSKYDFTPA